ncbi:tRNA1(Val) (adenine(37)-N6)-methyltransferase [Sphingobacterium corticibacterium]|uniref:tRNA1(Val) (adenine(37)-N6)-methyltransferase n=1 Tax=Sphingobacterium corticibacterium TaxID=2484746 RepID=A0A4Q6XQH5_9SPHI|nr:methyltransferase [Sphingobacterium corticibacterium]RZF59654.1 methyltransferase domain-containing protein [Sphingobacterium corticibacterium]
MRSIFRFKQFEIDQGNCAMKINTDGVLLGSSTNFPEARRILDVGTGTGVIALMLAQSHPHALIDAVEIEEDACQQANINFQKSDFAERLQVFPGSFADLQPELAYDLIVSNPPFYTNSLHNPDTRKRLAKHTDILFFEKLLSFVSRYLTDNGQFKLIIPVALADEEIAPILADYKLYVQDEIAISSFSKELPIRKIWGIGKKEVLLETQAFHIYAERGIYSADYKTLLKPYFLAF